MIIMDLDPGDDVSWQEVIDAAVEVHERHRSVGLESFVKTSGGKGLHVVAPLKPAAGWNDIKAFTKRIADAVSADSPDRFAATVTKSKRKARSSSTICAMDAARPPSRRIRRARGLVLPYPCRWIGASSALPSGPAYFHGHQRTSQARALDADLGVGCSTACRREKAEAGGVTRAFGAVVAILGEKR